MHESRYQLASDKKNKIFEEFFVRFDVFFEKASISKILDENVLQFLLSVHRSMNPVLLLFSVLRNIPHFIIILVNYTSVLQLLLRNWNSASLIFAHIFKKIVLSWRTLKWKLI